MALTKIEVLSGGAAQGLVTALGPAFEASEACEIVATYGAVGAMRDKLLAGAPADLLILTRSLIDELARAGHVKAGSSLDIGTVVTALAVRGGDPVPPVADAESLRAALRAADAIYFPDPKLATAGIHFANVLARLGISEEVASRLKPFPNGAAAMRELATAKSARPLGCTQVTEILNTPGVQLAAALPPGFDLATVYTAGVCAKAANPEQARALAAMLAGETARRARQQAGFA